MNQEARKTPDPGPPTWAEAIEGFRTLRDDSSGKVRQAYEALRFTSPNDEGPAYTNACANHSAADAEWKHWNVYLLRASAFLAVHPFMAHSLITAKCAHANACWVGDDDGFYRDPMPIQSRVLPREREPGDDSDDEAGAA